MIRLIRTIAGCLLSVLATPAGAGDVTTYHGDSFRTGWNATETVLTPALVGSNSFGPLGTVALDSQVDAEPLFLGGLAIAGGKHNVVYVATENDTVYAIDADSGTILRQRNLGAAVPMSELPGGCSSAASTVGITGTPVIDRPGRTLYAIAYTYEGGMPVYRLHALDLATLADKITPATVSAVQPLSDGGTYSFNPVASRQRAALLAVNGNIYAGFASFCDQAANVSRGWVLGWQAGTLEPLSGQALLDQKASAPRSYFLSGIWMSGYGIAADEQGSLFFVTGNSDPSGTSYDPATNLAESVVKLSPGLTKVQSYFSPDSPKVDVAMLDRHDGDFGAGGVMVLPVQPGATPRLAVAAGKAGILYVMNRDALGGFLGDGVDHVLGSVRIGPCWCGPSYFAGADGIGRVVTSGGATAIVWKVSPTGNPMLIRESVAGPLATGQDGGFFTSVSSNGTKAHTQIVWAVTRPVDLSATQISLTAFDPSAIDPKTRQMAKLFDAPAGTWPSPYANANIVPLVANHRVYVASYGTLAIFGPSNGSAATAAGPNTLPASAMAEAETGHRLTGIVQSVLGPTIVLLTRDGEWKYIDASAVAPNMAAAWTGQAVSTRGAYGARGVLKARTIQRAKTDPALWPPDR